MKKLLFSLIMSIYLVGINAFIVVKSPKKVSAESLSLAECVMEITNRRILYAEHGDLRLPMASTTKIVTAISVIESGVNLDKNIVISNSAVGIEGSSVYLKAGEEYSIKELLYGLMLRSGNDCAVALAESIDGEMAGFCSRMNAMAFKAGALNSHFSNPHGLPTKNHYTTAIDLSLIAAYAMKNSTFCEIVSTKYYTPRNWKNKNKMLTNYDGAIGIKTGYTKEAGRCLVTAAERDGMQVVVTVLNSPNMYERTKTLLDDAFARYKNRRILSANTIIEFDGGKGIVMQDFYYPMLEGEEAHVEIIAKPLCCQKNKKIVGQFEIYLLKRLLFSGNLYKL